MKTFYSTGASSPNHPRLGLGPGGQERSRQSPPPSAVGLMSKLGSQTAPNDSEKSKYHSNT